MEKDFFKNTSLIEYSKDFCDYSIIKTFEQIDFDDSEKIKWPWKKSIKL